MSESQAPAVAEISEETYAAFVKTLLIRTGDLSKDFTHAILGIVTEIHELQNAVDEVNAIEETGDIFFYTEALCQVLTDLQGGYQELDGQRLFREVHQLQDYCEEVGVQGAISAGCNYLLDTAKAWIAYGRIPDDTDSLFCTATALGVVAAASNPDHPISDIQRVIRANMAKLMKRYKGGKFTELEAMNRDLEAEREVLASA